MNTKHVYWQGVRASRRIFRMLNSKLKPLYCPLLQENNRGVFAVDISARGIGLFAQMNQCLHIFAHCERYGLHPYIILSSKFYVRSDIGDNWLEYFFDNLLLTRQDQDNINNNRIRICHINEINELGLKKRPVSELNIALANRLLFKYLRLKPDIQEYVDAFVQSYFGDKKILGIHYRGTDKSIEAPLVEWSVYKQVITRFLEANPEINALYVASDEAQFIEKVEDEFDFVEVILHGDQETSRNGNAIHTQHRVGDNYRKGKEALVNCLLLSRCSALIRTTSFLSAWASIFNPDLPVVMLNKPFGDKLWFPDSEIINNSLYEYLPEEAT